MISNIIILTGPIISGKTSVLEEVLAQRKSVRGFLTPDVEGRREVHILPQGSENKLLMQADEAAQNTVSIGRYHFYTAAFTAMKKELVAMAKRPAEWNVVDELGKLELKGRGLSPELDQVIAEWKTPGHAGRLLLIVRDELLEKAVAKFGLEQATVIQKEDAQSLF